MIVKLFYVDFFQFELTKIIEYQYLTSLREILALFTAQDFREGSASVGKSLKLDNAQHLYHEKMSKAYFL